MNGVVIVFAWCWIMIGLLSGACIGLRFYRKDWLGGYDSWERRMIRLGHIAFLGTAILNILAVASFSVLGFGAIPILPAVCLIIGAVSMPTVCFLSAWYLPFRHLFAIPVVALTSGVFWTLVALWNG